MDDTMMRPEGKMKKMMKETSEPTKNVMPPTHSSHSPAEMAKYCKDSRAGEMMTGKGGLSGKGKKISKFHKGS